MKNVVERCTRLKIGGNIGLVLGVLNIGNYVHIRRGGMIEPGDDKRIAVKVGRSIRIIEIHASDETPRAVQCRPAECRETERALVRERLSRGCLVIVLCRSQKPFHAN